MERCSGRRAELGWFEVETTPSAADDPVLGGVHQSDSWRCSGTTTPASPGPGTATLARNDVCDQAFRIGEAAWGTQFHIEVTRRLLLDWWDEGEEYLREAGYDHARYMRELEAHHALHEQIGRDMAERFAAYAASRGER